MRWPLRNQIFLPIAGLLTLAVILFTAVSAWLAAEVSSAETRRHMDAVAHAIGNASYPLTDDVVGRIAAMIDGDVVVLDCDQNLAASTMGSSEALRSKLAALSVARAGESSFHVASLDSRKYLVTAIHRSHTPRPGTLFVLLPETEFRLLWQDSVLPPLLAALPILILALALAMLISRRVAGRVDQLRELFRRLPSGEFGPVEVTGRDDEIRDLMTSANQLSDQLRTLRERLLTAERLQLLGQLSGGLAHQLRNSIAGARMAIQLHQRNCTADDRMITTALAQLALTEEQVMAVVSLRADSSVDSGSSAAEVCDLCTMLLEVTDLLQPYCTHWKSALTVDVPESLAVELVSPRSMKGALLNIVQNAIEAAGLGGTIHAEVLAKDDCAVIEVRDSGPGFSLSRQELVSAFRTTKVDGIGLGLTIAQHAVDQEHGDLIMSSAGGYTSVQIRIPAPAPRPHTSREPSAETVIQ
ncbi:MAG: HAMP domain-containing sensor histidine kinase [Planctomycetaceae bacterium]